MSITYLLILVISFVAYCLKTCVVCVRFINGFQYYTSKMLILKPASLNPRKEMTSLARHKFFRY